MSRSHAEIEHQVCRLARLLAELGLDTPEPEDVVELLHNAQEDGWAFSLLPDAAEHSTP